MKRLNNFILSLSCLLFLAGGVSYAQTAPPASATGHIFAEIIPMFTAIETAQLNFGRFAPGPQGGEIILTPASTISILGGVYRGAGTPNAASFYISGDIDAAYTITLPVSPVVLTHISNAKTMKIENWMSIPAPGPGTGKLQDGFEVVYVGATLKVGSLTDNPVGIYTGTYTITFDFY